ncbi:hypothetical protein GOP47_0029887 [Adiantum capillus-veneris]|nr:hypothetical protein GOP47_0029887 [Adiantum capillus-veneris]
MMKMKAYKIRKEKRSYTRVIVSVIKIDHIAQQSIVVSELEEMMDTLEDDTIHCNEDSDDNGSSGTMGFFIDLMSMGIALDHDAYKWITFTFEVTTEDIRFRRRRVAACSRRSKDGGEGCSLEAVPNLLQHSSYFQLATVRRDGRPANRTVVFRGFVEESNILQFTTDYRSNKIEEILHNPRGEVNSTLYKV